MGFSKRCTKCGKVKWWYQFGKRKQGLFNLQSICKACVSQYSLRGSRKNQEKVKDSYRKWKEKNPEKAKESRRKHYHKNKFIVNGARKLKITIPEARSLLYQNKAEVLKVAKKAKLGKYEKILQIIAGSSNKCKP
jgi:hypothetical protein